MPIAARITRTRAGVRDRADSADGPDHRAPGIVAAQGPSTGWFPHSFGGAEQGHDYLARQQQRAARTVGGWLLIAGSMLVVGVLVLTYLRDMSPAGRDTRPLAFLLCIPTILLGLVLLLMRRQVPVWLLNISPSFTAVLICLPSAVDDRPGPLGPLLLIWPVVYAAAVLSERVAWATMGSVAASFALLSAVCRGVDGVILWVEVIAGIFVAFRLVISVRHQSEYLRRMLEALATTDPLTGLGNRRAFDAAVERERCRRARGGGPLSILAVDIDHFKRVNDAFGHAAGDRVLALLGRLLAEQVRAVDTVGRLGGEEFAVLLSGCPAEEAVARAQQLCDAVRIESAGWEHSITISVGVATLPDDAADPAELRVVADAALYRAKASGRDRVEACAAA